VETEEIVEQLRQERHRIDSAIAALEGTRGGIRKAVSVRRTARRGRRGMSAAARKKIAEMAKARWAGVKAE
jgi:hypothetical protein